MLLSISRGPETLQFGAAKWSHHCAELNPWRRTWHLFQDLDKSWHRDGSLHRQGHFTRACGSLQEQQSNVGGKRRSTGVACILVYPRKLLRQVRDSWQAFLFFSGFQWRWHGALFHRCQPRGSSQLDDLHQMRPQRARTEPGGRANRKQHILQSSRGSFYITLKVFIVLYLDHFYILNFRCTIKY